MLNVYRASAGSGKTFRLTLEYIKLLLAPPDEGEKLFQDERNRRYRRILAVTFTNKATDEMKKRIVKELFCLSSTPEKSPLIHYLLGKDGITGNIDDLRRQASEQLFTLLHDFSGFNISTIDRFFQQIARSFMYEAGLSNRYNIELDSASMLTEAVDQMFFELEKSENKELLKWLVGYARQQIEEDSYKKFRTKIEELAGEIFKEQYKSHRDKIQEVLQDRKSLENYIGTLESLKRDFEKQVKECADEALALMQQNGIAPDDFKNGSRSGAQQFRKWVNGDYTLLPNSYLTALSENEVDKWYTSKNIDAATIDAIHRISEPLRACMQRIVALYGKPYTEYLSAVHTGRHLYTLGILNDVVEYLQTCKNERGALLLSDTNDLLRHVISDTDTPFVYEKIGTYINHFFIDEFQDTSVTQWNNFYPLVKESNDRALSNLVVGDVKQSVYRWRNSDWELLNERLPEYFPKNELKEWSLDTNWRSAANVVHFNNSFFDRAAACLQQKLDERLPAALADDFSDKIESVYRNSAQKTGEGVAPDSGYVEVAFFEDDKENKDEGGARAQVLAKLSDTLRDLQERGIALRDTAILVRTKEEGNCIVQHLLQEQAAAPDSRYRYDVISDEALYIGNSPTVRLIIFLLDYLNAPQEALRRFFALYAIAVFCRKIPEDAAIARICADMEAGRDSEELARVETLRGEPLYEICEKIIDLFPVDTVGNENVFVQAFLDLVLQYADRHSSDLDSFLLWWHDKGCTRSLSTPGEQDAIRIMTIHKAKGLEFDAVLVPFCNWLVDHSSNHAPILWAETGGVFGRLPVVPLTYRKDLADTIYSRTYFSERLHTYIDNLNLAYVAFTRAREELYVFVPKGTKDNHIGTILQKCIEEGSAAFPDGQPAYIDLRAGYDPDNARYVLGTKKSYSAAPVESGGEYAPSPYRSIAPSGRLRLRLLGKGYFDLTDGRHRGTVYHDVLSAIRTPDDLDEAIRSHIRSGEITRDEAQEIAALLRTRLADPEVQAWFAAGSRVLNENEILVPRQGAYRPDRIVLDGNRATVVDYKFGAERRTHHRQVARYMKFLQEMGFAVQGFLWYVTSGTVVPVLSVQDEE